MLGPAQRDRRDRAALHSLTRSGWDDCTHSDWMLELLVGLQAPGLAVVRCACDLVGTVADLMPDEHDDDDGAVALASARAWAERPCAQTAREAAEAGDPAYWAGLELPVPACDAVLAAGAAARAVADPAAAGCAARSADTAAWVEQDAGRGLRWCDGRTHAAIVRRHFPWPAVELLSQLAALKAAERVVWALDEAVYDMEVASRAAARRVDAMRARAAAGGHRADVYRAGRAAEAWTVAEAAWNAALGEACLSAEVAREVSLEAARGMPADVAEEAVEAVGEELPQELDELAEDIAELVRVAEEATAPAEGAEVGRYEYG